MTPAAIRAAAQQQFEGEAKQFGKGCYIHRLPDTLDIRNRGAVGNPTVARQPADYIALVGSQMFYAEVKGTNNLRPFPLARIEPSQWAGMRQSVAASKYNNYQVFLWIIPKQKWAILSGRKILTIRDQGITTIHLPEEELLHDNWIRPFI